jgi:twitching motility protein PilT
VDLPAATAVLSNGVLADGALDNTAVDTGAARHADAYTADTTAAERPPVDTLLHALVEAGGSDLHLAVGAPPMIRVHGDLQALRGYDPLTPQDTAWLIRGLVSDAQWERFEQDQELDLAYDIPGVSRFRVNLFQQRNAYGTVMRAIPHLIKPLHELGIPEQISQFAFLPRGLVLVTGPTGSGKTTTLASLLDLANRSSSCTRTSVVW